MIVRYNRFSPTVDNTLEEQGCLMIDGSANVSFVVLNKRVIQTVKVAVIVCVRCAGEERERERPVTLVKNPF